MRSRKNHIFVLDFLYAGKNATFQSGGPEIHEIVLKVLIFILFQVVSMEHAILSVPLPVDVKSKMDKRRDIRWVEVARQAILERLSLLERMDAMLSQSDFSEQDAIALGRSINRKIWEKSGKQK